MHYKKSLLLVVFTGLIISISAQDKQVTALPEPRKEGGMPLYEALDARHSTRNYTPKALPDQMLSNLLWAAFGINRENGKRTAPSSRNKQEMEIYAAMPDGLYKYLPEKHAILKIKDEDIRAVTGKQDFVGNVSLNLIYVANYKKAGDKATSENYRFTSGINTGFIAQNVYLFCASENLGSVVRAWFDKQKLTEALGLEDHQEVILTQSVGYPQ